MKKINTTNIAAALGAPFLKATHDQYKETIQETTGNIIKGLMGSYSTNDIVILYGCVVAVTGGSIPGTGTATLTAGAVYYNGEIYEVDANASLSTTNPQTLIWQVVTTYRSGDPVEWSDGLTRDLHQQDKLRLVAGTAGGGLANYNESTVKRYSSGSLAPTYQTGWSAGSAPFAYEKIGNIVYLRGRVVRGVGGTNLITQMPSGYRPKEDMILYVFATDSASAPTQRQISIDTTDGDVRDGGGAVSTEIYYFDNISYIGI
jgi:hypothetical protein